MLVLLPLDFVKLPLNIIPVDVWILLGLPVLVLSFVRGKKIIGLAYVIPMWLIFTASILSTFFAPEPKNSLVVILKELYAFIWFIILAAVLATLGEKENRLILIVWSMMVFVHGLIIAGQFLSPSFWQFTLRFGDRSSEFDIYRPSGLFINANSAALFQLLGFVPLMMASPSGKVALLLGILLLPTMLLTGSMGAAIALVAGLVVAASAIALTGRLVLVIGLLVRLGIALLLLGGLFYLAMSHNERYQEHIHRILLGRAERSSGGRFDLWQQGLDAYVEHDVFLWGIGPENFRVVGEKGKQSHNDLIAFSVERGFLGTLGLVLFATLAVGKAAYIVLIANKHPDRARPIVVTFLGAMTAVIVESLTHQTFHFRELWVVLALQEATLYRMTTAQSQAHEPYASRVAISHAPAVGRYRRNNYNHAD